MNIEKFKDLYINGSNQEYVPFLLVLKWIEESTETPSTDGREELEKENERLRDGIKWACDNPRSVFVFNELQKLLNK